MKRFYKEVAVSSEVGGWRVTLDGRGIRTARGAAQLLPTKALAEAMSQEWAQQGETIDPARFMLRDMADYAIDVVAAERGDVIATLLGFAETDTLCYRAEAGEPLLERQEEVWEPLLRVAEARWDVHFERISGIIHRSQPAATIKRLEAVLQAEGPFALAALNTLTSLAASLVIGLAALAPDADAETLWAAAELEGDWQADLWGKDAEAEDRRARRLDTFASAMRFAALARG